MSEFSKLPTLPCLCASLRRASRALTQSYEDALRPLGLRATQFTVLQVLSLAGGVSQGELGRMLAMDSTTLTRTLEIMHRNGWIAKQEGADRRERRIRLTKGGDTKLQRANPVWEDTQARFRRRLGKERWSDLLAITNEVTKLATT